jgi:hypothetical protein
MLSVKTMLDLPESLVREAEKAARAKGMALDNFLAALLCEKLEGRPIRPRGQWPVPPPELDLTETRRIQQFIDEEFGTIEWENWR